MFRSLLYLTLVLLISSCSTLKRKKIIPYNKMNTISEVILPFESLKTEFINLIDSYLPDTLFESNEDDGIPFDLKIFKGNLSNIELVGKTLNITLSMKIEVEKEILFFSPSAKGELKVDLYSQIDIDENWQLTTNTSLVDYQWIEKPEIDLKVTKISTPDWILKYIDSKQSEWLSQLDSSIFKKNILKNTIDSFTKILNKPYKLDSAGLFGIKITPNKIGLSPFKSYDDKVKGAIKFEFVTDIISFDQYIQPDSLKYKFYWNYNKTENQKISISLNLDQNKLQKLVDDYLQIQDLKTNQFEFNGDTIQVDYIDILINNEQVGAKIGFSGDKKGNVLIKTRPFWNENLDKFILKKNIVDISMSDLASKFLLSIFGGKAKKIIISKSEEQLNQKINKTLKDTNLSLKEIKLKNNLQIINLSIPTQVENRVLLLDINFNIYGYVFWNGINIYFPADSPVLQ